MNTPDIRFKGFTDTWEQRKLGEIASFTRGGGTPDTSIESYWNGDIPWIQSSDLTEDRLFDVKPKKHISKNGLDKSATQLVPKESIAVVIRVGVGKLAYMPFSYTTSQDFLSLCGLKIKPEFATYAIYQMLQRELQNVQGTSIKGITKEDLLYKKISFPINTQEQTCIGLCIRILDNLITFHQRKLDTLKNYKKAMLVKMFPREGQKVPEIRFKGFTGDWEKRKFEEAFDILQNNTFSRAELCMDSGVAINIHYGDVLIHYGDCTNVSEIPAQYIASKQDAEKYKKSWLRNGDIVLADTAEDEAAGKCTEILGVNTTPVIAGLHTMPLRPKDVFAERFLGYYMNSDSYHSQLIPFMHGTKVLSLSKKNLYNTHILFPRSYEEQLQIGNFFRSIDALIVDQERKNSRLNNLKQAMLNKMFAKGGN